MARLFRPSLVVLLEPTQWNRLREAVDHLIPGELGDIFVLSANVSQPSKFSAEHVAPGVSQPEKPPFTPRPGVILLTDRAVSAEELGQLLHSGDSDRRKPVPVHIVSLGCDLPGDVALPEDTPPEAVGEVLRLLAKLARLRSMLGRRQHLVRRLKRAAFRDPLTGLLNRRAWPRVFRSVWQQAKRTHQQMVVALFDLDNFKSVNDILGHRRGDELLRNVGLAARQACRRSDYLFRWGGDEIALVCIIDPNVQAEPIVDRVREKLAIKIVDLDDKVLTASAGVTVISPHPLSTSGKPVAKIAEEMIQHADQALRRAKSLGGNTVCRFP